MINNGGQYSSFTLDDLPVWLTAHPMAGQLLPLDSRAITFSISSQLGFGVFTDTLYADIPGLGREPLVVKVSVLANPPAWSVGAANNYEFSMTITGQLNIGGETSTDPNDIIGAFIQNQAGIYECRGVATPEYVSYDGGSYQFFLTVQSDTEEGEPLIFKVWDASQCKEHYGITEEFTFYSGFVHGTPLSPLTVHVSPQLISNISCKTGWTWLSTNLLDQQSMDLNHILGSINATNNDVIKSQTQYAQYTAGSGWVGSLGSLTTSKAYKLKLAANSNLQIIGLLENPNTTPISYGSGWNWISYLPHVSISVNEALADIASPVSGDMIKNQRAYAQYISGYGWVGSLRFMNPGEGYLLKTANAGSFYYPDYQVTRSWERYRDPDPLVQVPGWDLDPLAYEYSANITGIIQSGGITLPQSYVIGAFVNGECRGIASATQALGSTMYFLTVYANTFNETLSFKAYNTLTQTETVLPNSLPFINNQVTGNPTNPYTFLMPALNLAAPQNVKLSSFAGGLKLSWDAVPGAEFYSIYTTTNPNAAFETWILSGVVETETQWIDPQPQGYKFYRITAGAGASRTNQPFRMEPGKSEHSSVFDNKTDNQPFITKPEP